MTYRAISGHYDTYGPVRMTLTLGLVPPSRPPDVLRCGRIRGNLDSRRAYLDGKEINLTGTEYVLLRLLAERFGKEVSRTEISPVAFGRCWRPEDRTVDQLVFALRNKLAHVGGPQCGSASNGLIGSYRGRGYFLRGAA